MCSSCLPFGRNDAVAWSDPDGNGYVFSGSGFGYLNDLWKYSPEVSLQSSGTWHQLCNPCSNSLPSIRSGGVSWTDNNGNSYLFGGLASSGYLNDLLQYNISSNKWIELCSLCAPVARQLSVSWTDNSGNAYIFGGNNGVNLNDLWRYNIAKGAWSQLCTSSSCIATLPTARSGSVSWTDNSGNAYIFGGNNGVNLNDLWRYNIATGLWSQLCTSSSCIATLPTVRSNPLVWKDQIGNVYLFGVRSTQDLNGLWII